MRFDPETSQNTILECQSLFTNVRFPYKVFKLNNVYSDFQEKFSIIFHDKDVINLIPGQAHKQPGYPWKYHNKIHDYICKIFQQEHTQVHCPATRKSQIVGEPA